MMWPDLLRFLMVNSGHSQANKDEFHVFVCAKVQRSAPGRAVSRPAHNETMHLQVVKMHLHVVKMHLQMVKIPLQMVKMHLQMVMQNALASGQNALANHGQNAPILH